MTLQVYGSNGSGQWVTAGTPAIAPGPTGSAPALPAVGANKGAYTSMAAACGPLASLRAYMYPASALPPTYPGPDAGPIPPAVRCPVISIAAPYSPGTTTPDVGGVIAGTYDTQIAAYFASITVPSGGNVFITMGHEYEANYNTFTTPSQLRAMHQHVAALFDAHAPDGVSYGQVFSSWTGLNSSSNVVAGLDHYPITQWVGQRSSGEPLDWYGIDGYYDAVMNSVASVLDGCRNQILAAQPGAVVGIAELNASIASARPAFFAQAWEWAKAITPPAPFVCFYWGSPNPPYGWGTATADVITEMSLINSDSKA